MRIIAGIYGGRILYTGYDKDLRPTTDRVKETIFNVLVNKIELAGRDVLDLYAGSGNLGLEALSRGAKHVAFVDSSLQAARTVRRNIELLKCAQRCRVFETDVVKFLNRTVDQFDVVLADPPYDVQSLDGLTTGLFSTGLLRNDGVAVVQHRADVNIIDDVMFMVDTRREFGETAVTFLRHRPKSENL